VTPYAVVSKNIKLFQHIRSFWIPKKPPADLDIRRVNRHVKRRKAVLHYPTHFLLPNVGQGYEITVTKGKTIIVIFDIERPSQALWIPLHKAKITTVTAHGHFWWCQLHTQREALTPYHFEVYHLSIWVADNEREGIVRGQVFPVEKIFKLLPIDG
jgi:hypothetical protein